MTRREDALMGRMRAVVRELGTSRWRPSAWSTRNARGFVDQTEPADGFKRMKRSG